MNDSNIIENDIGQGSRLIYIWIAELKKKLKIFISLPIINSIILVLLALINQDERKWFSYIAAGIFWLIMILQIVLILKASKIRKHIENCKNESSQIKTYRLGLISFFNNKEGTVSDIIFIVSIILLIFILVFEKTYSLISVICFPCLFLSFNLHCIFNGKNYTYIKLLEIEEGKRNG